ncbi:MAG: T9SS type A sorting domain-containing protein [Bacteroidia bacterium]|nr:T9SS type A sorting domain-containing protein [Bacteroidia bacterium]
MNNLKAILLSSVFFISVVGNSFAQNARTCGTDEMTNIQMQLDPIQMQYNIDELEEFTQEYIKNYQPRTEGGPAYIIPMVIHVIHTYGGNNISKAQVNDAIRIINEDYSKSNADTTDIISAFSGIIGKADVEFRLAKKDPNGNCTDGITRTFSNLTDNAGENVKGLVKWPTNMYVNVWVVSNIASGAGAYAYLPSSPNVSNHGIVNRNSQFGSIGTSNGGGLSRRTLTHELGHHFNLSHVWGGTNTPNVSGNCSNDDFVSDTPNCIGVGNQSCNLNQNTCGSLDNIQNIMEYSSCPKMFTNGQVARMQASLNSSVGNRNNLWSPTNLTATGTDGAIYPDCTPIADFKSSTVYICSGTNVTFTDASWNGNITGWNWSFPGGTPATSNSQNPVVSYASEGTYDVSLTVTSSAGSNSITRPAHVVVNRAAAWYSIPFAEGFENIGFPGGLWSIENGGGNAWELTTDAAYSGNKCIKIQNYTGNTQQPDAVITPSYNLSNVSSTMMTFKMAFAVRSTSGADALRIYASTNCGQTWSVRYTKSGLNLATAGLISSNFIPTSTSQWREETVNLSTSSVSGRDNVMFKIEYTNDTGNNLYIDDINITGVVGTEEISAAALNLNIFPNPTEGNTTVGFTLLEDSDVKIEVIDMLGRSLNTVSDAKLNSGQHQFEITDELTAGMYFIKLTIDSHIVTEKLLVE